IGTWGHGSFRYSFPDIGAEGACPGVNLLVRDNVFDRGQSPSPNGVPDPEWPILVKKDPAHPNDFPNRASDPSIFFKTNDTPDGKLYFWESTDIRVEVPFGPQSHDATLTNCPGDPAGSCPIDSVEFDSCPTQVGCCPDWMLHNMDPRRSPTEQSNFYVQVANNALGTAHQVRVITLLANAAAGVPKLPDNFWQIFPEGGGCPQGTVDLGTGWKEVGFQVIADVGPFHPAVAKFPFNVPMTQADHSCMVAIVDSPQDKLVLGANKTDVELLARNDRHVAQRNLHVIDGPSIVPGTCPTVVSALLEDGTPFSGLTTLNVPN